MALTADARGPIDRTNRLRYRPRSMTRHGWRFALACAVVALGVGSPAGAQPTEGPAAPPTLRVEVLASYPHDAQAFTQGLVLHDGALYESTGLYGRSSLRQVEPETGT